MKIGNLLKFKTDTFRISDDNPGGDAALNEACLSPDRQTI